MPITPLSGVRISWLMLARNSLLARLPSSARLRAVSSSADWSCSCAMTRRGQGDGVRRPLAQLGRLARADAQVQVGAVDDRQGHRLERPRDGDAVDFGLEEDHRHIRQHVDVREHQRQASRGAVNLVGDPHHEDREQQARRATRGVDGQRHHPDIDEQKHLAQRDGRVLAIPAPQRQPRQQAVDRGDRGKRTDGESRGRRELEVDEAVVEGRGPGDQGEAQHAHRRQFGRVEATVANSAAGLRGVRVDVEVVVHAGVPSEQSAGAGLNLVNLREIAGAAATGRRRSCGPCRCWSRR